MVKDTGSSIISSEEALLSAPVGWDISHSLFGLKCPPTSLFQSKMMDFAGLFYRAAVY